VTAEDFAKKEHMPKIDAPDAATYVQGNESVEKDGPSD